MDRRGFLRLLGVGAAGFALDPERLLWVPGQKTIFDLGPRIVAPPNTFLTVDFITRETLLMFKNNLRLATDLNREFDRAFHLPDLR